jgi:magnesium chelatase subunit I
LRASGHTYLTVKDEIRRNLLARMRAGEERFPGIIGFGQTVLPHLERALLAGHDTILLGERGQGKTRLIRTLPALLDEWTPTVAGCEINDHPFAPACARAAAGGRAGRRPDGGLAAPSERYGEKLATPRHQRRGPDRRRGPGEGGRRPHPGRPETIHFGLVPRTNRGVFCLNELPDLAERIQVSLLNVLEERDIAVRGYALRLPLDLVLVASANPEDYTNRGTDHHPAEGPVRGGDPHPLPGDAGGRAGPRPQEAEISWPGGDPGAALPGHLVEVIARFTRLVRASPAIDSRSGVSARFAIAAAESACASAVRRRP